MAEQRSDCGVEFDQNPLNCSVCLDLLKEPVTIPCGHSYCKNCIERCWDQQEFESEFESESESEFSCPLCRETFRPRPVLRRNNMLAELVDKLKKSAVQQAPPPEAEVCAGPADVACDFCTGTRRHKATMSCLTCLVSYCAAHLESHHSVPALKKHQLVSTTIPLQDKICEKHNKLMEVYCRKHRQLICSLCALEEHEGHTIVLAAAERAEEQKQLSASQNKVQERFKERETDLCKLIQALKDFKTCSQTAMNTNDKIFDELISHLKKKRSLSRQLIRAQEKSVVIQAEDLQLQLEEEIATLKTRHTELGQLSHVDDHIYFIQTFRSMSTSCENPDLLPGPAVYPKRSFKVVTDCVSELRDDMEKLLNDTWLSIDHTVSTIEVVLPPVPKTRDGFLRYARPLTLDQDSASKCLSISNEYRRATCAANVQYDEEVYGQHQIYCSNCYAITPVPRDPNIGKVLCKEALSERCYWEVTISANWSVAVSYKDHSSLEFGSDDRSWSLDCLQSSFSFRHNNQSVTLGVSRSQYITVGVFLDYKAGTLSFYNGMTLLHKVDTMFTQPLYPGLGFKEVTSQSSYTYNAELIKLW